MNYSTRFKQTTKDADPKAIQQINFTGNLTRREFARKYFIIEEVKGTVLKLNILKLKII